MRSRIDANATARAYVPRGADSELLYRIVAAELEGLLKDAAERDHPLPRFVETTLREFLKCGVAEHGFVVLTLPFPLRYRLAYDRKLVSPVLAAFLRVVLAHIPPALRPSYPPVRSRSVVR
jgi:hypothetical protein